ncbi:filamentous hemagglutinin outer membrane protein [Scytonema sp. HK-05]|nr:filamentous hemagglutinin outer membrane protein [Scytonema sp. HK-05]
MNRWHLKSWFLIGSALSVLACALPIAAQVVPDNTLPKAEQTQVTGNPNFQIDGGARRGGNLFHSFQQFSVPTGGSAFFNNAADVQNILTRVTGGSISNIDGLIRANGTANLFLLNPNGILFGPSASLNIGGSFVATTANALGFPNGEVFSSDAKSPLPSQLLTVNPNALFFNQLTQKPIIVQSRFDERVFNESSFNGTGLHVPPGQNLLLVGGAIQLDSGEPFIPTSPPGQPILSFFFYPSGRQDVQPDGGWLISPGSHVELGAVGGVGTVGLSTASSDWQLTIPDRVPRADVSFSNGSGIDVRGASGSIRLLAQNIDIKRSLLQIGIPYDSRLPDTQTGDIDLNATGSITLSRSRLGNGLFGVGTIGSINLSAGDLVSLDIADVSNVVRETGVGNAGSINITTGSLSLTDAGLSSVTYGQGNTGSVNINARDTVSFKSTYIFNRSETGVGNVGGINITTGSLSITNVSYLMSDTLGQGNAGSVNINARDTVSLTNKSGLRSSTFGQGNAGSVNINAYNTISLDDSDVANYIFYGSGNVGGINITTGSLSLTNGSVLLSNTFGQGNAGSVNINARDRVSLDGSPPIPGTRPSTIATQVGSETLVGLKAVGQGGNVTITTSSLSLTNGSGVNTSTLGQGKAGSVTINARDVQMSGTARSFTSDSGEVKNFANGVTTSVKSGGVGNGGDVTITTGSLSVSDFSTINTNTEGQGNAGKIQIQASDAVEFDGGNAISRLEQGGVGRGGDIDITARSLSLLNGAQLAASTSGEGNAGNITLSANTVGLSGGGQVLTTTASNGRAGDITVNTPDLQLSGATSGLFAGTTNAGDAGNLTIQPQGNGQSVRVNLQSGAQISASTSSSGRGGTLAITAPESITLTGNGSVIAAGTGGGGAGGNLTLRTGTLGIQNQAEVTVSSSGTGTAGNLFVDADRIFLDNQGRIRADTSGGGGNINLLAPLILLRNGSNISTNATGNNIPGGNIGIDTRFLVAGKNEDSNISANSQDFRGGNVSINAYSMFGIQPRFQPTSLSDITATGANSALNGTINVTTAGIDPTSGLVELPIEFVDLSRLIATGCPANEGNSFIITGRGGLPPTPEQELDDDAEWQDRRRLTVGQHSPQQPTPHTRSTHTPNRSQQLTPKPKSYTPIIEATGWQRTPSGEIILVATTPNPMLQHPLKEPVNCIGRQ